MNHCDEANLMNHLPQQLFFVQRCLYYMVRKTSMKIYEYRCLRRGYGGYKNCNQITQKTRERIFSHVGQVRRIRVLTGLRQYSWRTGTDGTSDVFVNNSLCRCFFYRKNRRRIYREDHDGRLPARGGVQHVHRENRKATLLMNSSSTDLERAGWFQSGVRLI